ncbi:hypothetical protein R6Q59_030258 [Mikania micrantha]
MSFTLNLVFDVLLSHYNSATIFTPPDSSFAESGQHSLSLLQVRFYSMAFSLHSIRSLPFRTKIPTVDSDTFLTVTTPATSDQVSINNVKIVGSPVFDDGSLIVFGIENFFDPNFTVSKPPVSIARLDRCTISWRDLINVDDGTGFDTCLEGFKIKITRSGGTFKVNDVPITFPNMYYSDSVVIHGIRCILSLPKPVDEVSDGDGNPFDETPAKTSGSKLIAFAPDRSEY